MPKEKKIMKMPFKILSAKSANFVTSPVSWYHCTFAVRFMAHYHFHKADSRFAASQWQTSLQSNGVSHWLGANVATWQSICCQLCSRAVQYRGIQDDMLRLHIWIQITRLPLDKMDAISQTTFSNAFSWMEKLDFWLKFHWSLFLRV